MFLIDPLITLFKLKWTQQEPKFRPLPPHIQRIFLPTKGGDLELLICEPKASATPQSSQPPIFFAHGGYGSAGVWLEWMNYLHEHNYSGTLYAHSVRNHGASYTLPYWRMVFQTPFSEIQSDMVDCLNYAMQQERNMNSNTRLPILVGHSSGGGLAQSLLEGKSPDPKLRAKASGLCLVGAIPSYGSYDIYWNWFKQDPWFPLRSWLHLQHPDSPLSTEELVHGAFFGHKYPRSQVGAFKQWFPPFESMGWPVGMMGSFSAWISGKNKWLNENDVVSNIESIADDKDKICVIIGKEDMMYRPWMWQRQCAEYRAAIQKPKLEKQKQSVTKPNTRPDTDSAIDAVAVESRGGVRLVLVDHSGHHVQNDVYNAQAAEALLRWAYQV